jgi:hypothetical protein
LALPGSFKDNVAITVANTATVIVAAAASAREREVTVYNNDTQTVFIGDGNVTTANGLPLRPLEFFVTHSIGPVYGIVAASTANVRVAEES